MFSLILIYFVVYHSTNDLWWVTCQTSELSIPIISSYTPLLPWYRSSDARKNRNLFEPPFCHCWLLLYFFGCYPHLLDFRICSLIFDVIHELRCTLTKSDKVTELMKRLEPKYCYQRPLARSKFLVSSRSRCVQREKTVLQVCTQRSTFRSGSNRTHTFSVPITCSIASDRACMSPCFSLPLSLSLSECACVSLSRGVKTTCHIAFRCARFSARRSSPPGVWNRCICYTWLHRTADFRVSFFGKI